MKYTVSFGQVEGDVCKPVTIAEFQKALSTTTLSYLSISGEKNSFTIETKNGSDQKHALEKHALESCMKTYFNGYDVSVTSDGSLVPIPSVNPGNGGLFLEPKLFQPNSGNGGNPFNLNPGYGNSRFDKPHNHGLFGGKGHNNNSTGSDSYMNNLLPK